MSINKTSYPLTRSKAYQDIVDRTETIEYQDFNPIIIDNIFTQDDINEIYSVVRSTPIEYLKVATWGGQASWLSTHFGKNIEDRINEIVFDIFGEEVKLLSDYSFVRYSEEFGYKPKLFPHADKRETPRFLLDVQIRADEEWGIIVEDTPFYLKDNQGLLFSGTNQQHWREKKDLSPHSRIDMIFFNLEFKDGREFPTSYQQVMQTRSSNLRDLYSLQDTPIKIDRKFNELQ